MMLPLLLLVHLAQRGARGEERAVEMDRQQLLPFGEFEVDERRDDLDAGIADQNVKRAEGLDHFGGADVHLFFVGDIHGDADGTLAARIDLPGSGIGRLLTEVGDGDLGAFSGEQDGDFLADSTGRTGDDRDFVLETHGTVLSSIGPSFSGPSSHARPCRARASGRR